MLQPWRAEDKVLLMAKLSRQNVPFTQVANEVLNDKNLSWKAKGLYAYLFSKPDDWDFSAHRIKMDSANGRDSVLSALKELEQKGYLERNKLGNGRVEYHLKFNLSVNPSTENPTLDIEPDPEKPTVGKAHGGKSRTISNKEVIVTKRLYSSETSSQVFNWDTYLSGMLTHSRKDINIIGFFFKAKRLHFSTKEKAGAAIKRHLKAAKSIMPFDKTEIGETIRRLSYEFPKFTVDTVYKELTK